MPKVTEEHRLARRAQIVAAARRCVAEQGFHKSTMADVIRESGLSAGAVYGYFKSKEEILAAIAEDALSSVDELFEKLLATEEPLTPYAALEAALHHIVLVAERPGGDVTRVAIQAWAEAMHNDEILGVARGKYTQLRGHFVAVARKAQ
jgi:AcrR family transcriptional regulator